MAKQVRVDHAFALTRYRWVNYLFIAFVVLLLINPTISILRDLLDVLAKHIPGK